VYIQQCGNAFIKDHSESFHFKPAMFIESLVESQEFAVYRPNNVYRLARNNNSTSCRTLWPPTLLRNHWEFNSSYPNARKPKKQKKNPKICSLFFFLFSGTWTGDVHLQNWGLNGYFSAMRWTPSAKFFGWISHMPKNPEPLTALTVL